MNQPEQFTMKLLPRAVKWSLHWQQMEALRRAKQRARVAYADAIADGAKVAVVEFKDAP